MSASDGDGGVSGFLAGLCVSQRFTRTGGLPADGPLNGSPVGCVLPPDGCDPLPLPGRPDGCAPLGGGRDQLAGIFGGRMYRGPAEEAALPLPREVPVQDRLGASLWEV